MCKWWQELVISLKIMRIFQLIIMWEKKLVTSLPYIINRWNTDSKYEFISWTHRVIYTFWKIQLMLLDLSRPLSIWKWHWSSHNYQYDSKLSWIWHLGQTFQTKINLDFLLSKQLGALLLQAVDQQFYSCKNNQTNTTLLNNHNI